MGSGLRLAVILLDNLSDWQVTVPPSMCPLWAVLPVLGFEGQ